MCSELAGQSTPKASLYTSLPYGASYQGTYERTFTYPLQSCAMYLRATTPSGNLTTLPLQPHLSERTNPEAWCAPVFISLHLGPAAWHCLAAHLSSHKIRHLSSHKICHLIRCVICHLIRWITHKTRMLQLLLQRVTSITQGLSQPNYWFHPNNHNTN